MEYLMYVYGFNANFIGQVHNSLKCGICHLVMRDPVQIMTCGHRFCSKCFDRVKGYSLYLKKELCCPVDSELIDINKVFSDRGVAKEIDDLPVKCSKHERGCSWKGELCNLQSHEEECEYEEDKNLHFQHAVQGMEVGDSSLLKDLFRRMGKCEDAIDKKDKDIASLKSNLQELKKLINRKQEEVELLEEKNTKVEEKCRDMKQQYDIKLENVILKSRLLENKVSDFENQLVLTKKQIQDQEEDVKSVKHELERISIPDSNAKCDRTNVAKALQLTLDHEIRNLNDDIGKIRDKIRDEMKEVKNYTEESLKKNTDKINNLDGLQCHVANIENILFRDSTADSNKIIIQWILQNYQHHFKQEKRRISPKFFVDVNGYCFCLEVEWSGEKKEHLGLFFGLCRGSNSEEVMKPFNMEVTLEISNNKGNRKYGRITREQIEANRESSFTINSGEQMARLAWGFPKMLSMPQLRKFIVNDMLFIKCILTPP